VVELAQAVAKPGEEAPRLIRLLRAVIAAGRTAPACADPLRALELLRLYFDVWVARLEGYWPELDACARCAAPLAGALRVGARPPAAVRGRRPGGPARACPAACGA